MEIILARKRGVLYAQLFKHPGHYRKFLPDVHAGARVVSGWRQVVDIHGLPQLSVPAEITHRLPDDDWPVDGLLPALQPLSNVTILNRRDLDVRGVGREPRWVPHAGN